MNRIAAIIFLGAVAGAVGVFVYNLADQRLLGWLTIGVLLGVTSQVPNLSHGRWFWWGLLGGAIVFAGWYVGRTVRYPLLTWMLLGALLGALCSPGGTKQRIGAAGIGLLGGLVGIHLLPVITMIVLPSLRLPTTFAYDIEELGLVAAAAVIAGTTAWLKGR